jgi:hypothetical protein
MARRQALIQRKTKTVRVTKSEQYLVNKKYLGDEPLLKGNYTNSDFSNALTWYNYMCTASDARDYIKNYLESKGRDVELKLFKKVPDSWIPTTAAWVARIMTRGTIVTPDSVHFFEKKFSECLKKVSAAEEETEQPEKVVVSVHQRMREKASDIIGEIESMLDKGDQFSLYDWLKANEIPAAYSPQIIAYYSPWLEELLEAATEPDNQLKEAYGHLTKKQLKDRILFFNKMIEDAQRYGENKKKTRAPRKPRTVSVEKKLKSLKFQKEDKEFKIASINPEKIIGAQELWTFNTKYKTLTVFRAIDRGGLQVKGTSIINYDEKNSFTKRTGRKPEEYVKKVLEGGKMVLRKLMDDMKEAPLAYRINENTILLRIIA